SSHRGMPHSRFKGKVGIVVGKRGNAYEISVKDGRAEKMIQTFPEHLKPVKG
ncbi:MAG: 50S ribosomal protein L21e, partial [Candidatus Aenigmatarchaeota archaeon]